MQEDMIERKLKIIPYENFSLDHPCNLAYRESRS